MTAGILICLVVGELISDVLDLFDRVLNSICCCLNSVSHGIRSLVSGLSYLLYAVIHEIALLSAGDIVHEVIIVKLGAVKSHLALAVLLLQNEYNSCGSCNSSCSDDCKNLPVHV